MDLWRLDDRRTGFWTLGAAFKTRRTPSLEPIARRVPLTMCGFLTSRSHVGCIASISIGLSELPDLVLTRLGIFPFGFKGAFGGAISLGIPTLPGGKYSLTLMLRGAFNGSASLGSSLSAPNDVLTLDTSLVATGLKVASSERSSGTLSSTTVLLPIFPFHAWVP
jgi:hypothetical protein